MQSLGIALAALALVSACEPASESAPSERPAAASPDVVPGADTRRRLAALQARYADRAIVMGEPAAIGRTGFEAVTFRYEPVGGEWPYGSGISLWRAGHAEPAWMYLHDGDFGPHHLVWEDLSGDGWPDLFFLAGEEDVFETHAFVWRDTSARAGDSTLVRVYVDENDYATLVDLDGDQVPELLDSGTPGSTHESVDECDGLSVPPELHERVQAEYARIGARFAEANFTYGTSRFAFWTLHLLKPVRVLRVRNTEVHDVTPRFAEHLRWRAGILEDLQPVVTEPYAQAVRRTVGYLRGKLGESQ